MTDNKKGKASNAFNESRGIEKTVSAGLKGADHTTSKNAGVKAQNISHNAKTIVPKANSDIKVAAGGANPELKKR